MTESPRVPVADLDRATAATAATLLRPSCASARWIERLVSGRPYGTRPALEAASDAAISTLGWPDIEQALAAHPRIGDRPPSGGPAGGNPQPGNPGSHPLPAGNAGSHPPPAGNAGSHPPPTGDRAGDRDREAAWSRQEQSGARDAPADVQAGLEAGNAAYEKRFGHVFLICATGMSAASMLAALQARLGHDPAAEREVVRDELMKIVRLRLAKTFE
ncbi:MAG: putative bifunctional allantoicase/OHCU decarboxylase [Actinomycetia bacterium]|nr:putative bifunctional allantoicase/OHCU decarboxylase [Actinomycetes bacterium]